MTREFSALLWKERQEVGKSIWVATAAAAIMFYKWVPKVAGDEVEHGLFPTNAAFYLLLAVTYTAGYLQTLAESEPDTWAFAIHRRATPWQIFGAKVIAGGVPIFVSAVVAGTVTMAIVSTVRHLPFPSGFTHWTAAIGDCFAAMTYYAAGLNQGAPDGRGTRGYVGAGIAVIGTMVITSTRGVSAGTGIIASLGLTVLLLGIAYVCFSNPSEMTSLQQEGGT